MSILNNGKVLSRAVDLCDDSVVSQAFRSALPSGKIAPFASANSVKRKDDQWHGLLQDETPLHSTVP